MKTRAISLTEQVVQQLRAGIEAGEFPVGSRLPTGRALAEQFGVSPAVIREATESLRAQGLIQSRQGVGCTVLSRTGATGFQFGTRTPVDADALADIYELRRDLEGAAAAHAAQRRTEEDLGAMATLLERMASALRNPDEAEVGIEADSAFHIAIAKATHNPYYQQLLQYLNLQLRQSVRTARLNTLQQPGLSETVHQEHVAVYEAIRAGDAIAARDAAQRHLNGAAQRLGLATP